MHHNFANLLLPLSILLQAGKQSKMNLDKVHFIVLYVALSAVGICQHEYLLFTVINLSDRVQSIFTVVCLIAWPLNESETGVDLVPSFSDVNSY